MKLKEVTKAIVFFVETDEDEQNYYTRYSADNWTVRMGESDEPLFYCEEIEKLFQEWLSKNDR